MRTPPRVVSSFARLYVGLFNLLARRVVAPGFVVVGGVIALANLPLLLPGRTILFNGVPSDDFVLRLASVLFPLLVALLGVAMYRAKPLRAPWTEKD